MAEGLTAPEGRQRTCLDCGCVNTRTSRRCAPCFSAHKKKKQAEYVARAAQRAAETAERLRIWEAERPQREAAERAQRAKEAAYREAAAQAALLKARSPEGRAARKAAVDAALNAGEHQIKRGPAGTHSWAIIRVKELDSGELLPVEYRCRDCGTLKTVSFINRPTYTFPEGHDRHFPEGLPRRHIAGPCPYGPSAHEPSRFLRLGDDLDDL